MDTTGSVHISREDLRAVKVLLHKEDISDQARQQLMKKIDPLFDHTSEVCRYLLSPDGFEGKSGTKQQPVM